jgi:glycosyltransferase involved in cell wall biosynthesis
MPQPWFAAMKVCQIYLEGLSPEKGGGVASYLHGLVSGTHKTVDYLLITSYDKEDARVASRLYEHKAEIRFIQLRNCVLDLIALARHYRMLTRYHIVQFNDFYGTRDIVRCSVLILLLRVLSPVKLVFGFRTAGTEESMYRPLSRALYNFLFRRVSENWDKLVCNSNYMAGILLKRYRIPRNMIQVIPNGVDIELYRQADTLRLAGDPAVLFVGMPYLQYIKGMDLVLKAFQFLNREIPTSYLHIVGTEECECEYKGLVRQLGVQSKVQFHGRKSRKELSRIYKGADICIFPSRVESFGNVVLEAMASGRPIVATNVGGIPEIIEHNRNGLLVEPRTESVGKALLRLSRDRDLSERIRKNNEHDAVNHSWKRASEMYMTLYEQICMPVRKG